MAQAPVYEMKIQRLTGAQTQDEATLCTLGAQGWQLVSVVAMTPGFERVAYLQKEKR